MVQPLYRNLSNDVAPLLLRFRSTTAIVLRRGGRTLLFRWFYLRYGVAFLLPHPLRGNWLLRAALWPQRME